MPIFPTTSVFLAKYILIFLFKIEFDLYYCKFFFGMEGTVSRNRKTKLTISSKCPKRSLRKTIWKSNIPYTKEITRIIWTCTETCHVIIKESIQKVILASCLFLFSALQKPKALTYRHVIRKWVEKAALLAL